MHFAAGIALERSSRAPGSPLDRRLLERTLPGRQIPQARVARRRRRLRAAVHAYECGPRRQRSRLFAVAVSPTPRCLISRDIQQQIRESIVQRAPSAGAARHPSDCLGHDSWRDASKRRASERLGGLAGWCGPLTQPDRLTRERCSSQRQRARRRAHGRRAGAGRCRGRRHGHVRRAAPRRAAARRRRVPGSERKRGPRLKATAGPSPAAQTPTAEHRSWRSARRGSPHPVRRRSSGRRA